MGKAAMVQAVTTIDRCNGNNRDNANNMIRPTTKAIARKRNTVVTLVRSATPHAAQLKVFLGEVRKTFRSATRLPQLGQAGLEKCLCRRSEAI
jgi:hypothetical protein